MCSHSPCFLAARSAALVFVLATPVATHAQSTGEQAIALGREALELYSAQKFTECADKFASAQALSPSPVFQLYEARCLRGAGKYLGARERMRAVTAAAVAEDAPGPWRQAVLDAKAELPQLEKIIPSIIISAPGAKPEGLILRVDGVDVKFGEAVDLDPGSHKVTATYGAESRESSVELKDGQKSEPVVLSFGPTKSGPDIQGPDTKPQDSGGPGIVPGAVLTAIGGAAAIAGAVFGGLAIGKYENLEGCKVNEADDLVCIDEVAGGVDTLDSANLMADLSTGLLISGGVTLAVGVVLMIALPGDEAATALIPGGFRF